LKPEFKVNKYLVKAICLVVWSIPSSNLVGNNLTPIKWLSPKFGKMLSSNQNLEFLSRYLVSREMKQWPHW